MSAPAAQRLDLGRPIKGPTALGDDPRRFVILTKSLAVTDFKLRFYGSALGYLWSLMRPFLLFGVLFLVFDLFLNFGEGLVRYPVALLLGIVLHSYLNEGTSQAVRSLVTRESIVRKVEFPRLAVPLASVLAATFSLALNLVPIFVFLAILGGRPSWSWLQLPLLLGWLTVLVAGLAMLLSATYVRFRDVEPIWDVTLQVLFYATPIFWTINNLEGKPDWLQTLVFCNPLAAILQQARHAVVDESYDPAGTAIGTPLLLLIPIGITLLLVLVGYRTFAKQAPRVAEDL